MTSDENNPFFSAGKEADLFHEVEAAVKPPAAFKRVSWQAIARRLETKGEYEDLLDYLDERYGIVG
jgi:hypothetical protein